MVWRSFGDVIVQGIQGNLPPRPSRTLAGRPTFTSTCCRGPEAAGWGRDWCDGSSTTWPRRMSPGSSSRPSPRTPAPWPSSSPWDSSAAAGHLPPPACARPPGATTRPGHGAVVRSRSGNVGGRGRTRQGREVQGDGSRARVGRHHARASGGSRCGPGASAPSRRRRYLPLRRCFSPAPTTAGSTTLMAPRTTASAMVVVLGGLAVDDHDGRTVHLGGRARGRRPGRPTKSIPLPAARHRSSPRRRRGQGRRPQGSWPKLMVADFKIPPHGPARRVATRVQ